MRLVAFSMVCFHSSAGFCIPRNQWTVQPADAVDCPPQTYMQQQNGQTVW